MVGRWAVAVMLALAGLAGTPARAAGFTDATRYVFVAAQDQPQVSVIDSRDDRVVGAIDLGLVPSQLEIAGDQGRLLAVDGQAPVLALASLADGRSWPVALDFVPSRLAMAGDGHRVVAAAPAAGRLAVVEVATGAVVAQTTTVPFRDLAVAGDHLVLAPDSGLALLDFASLRPLAELAVSQGFATLARSPNGRVVYARAVAQPIVVAVDVGAARLVGEVASGAALAYTNAMGITLMLPEEGGEGALLVVPSSLKGGVRLRGEAGITGAYSGWFDTVAFLPSSRSRSVVVIDQQGGFRGDDITLGALPGRGTVTPDGRKLYLPLTDTHRVAVIDAERRGLAGYVALPARPAMAVMGRTFGLCH